MFLLHSPITLFLDFPSYLLFPISLSLPTNTCGLSDSRLHSRSIIHQIFIECPPSTSFYVRHPDTTAIETQSLPSQSSKSREKERQVTWQLKVLQECGEELYIWEGFLEEAPQLY